jgi:ubiquinone biosynthesis protein UbiJ
VLTETILEPASLLLNRGISQSSSATALCRELAERSLGVHLRGPDLWVRMIIDGERLVVGESDSDSKSDAVITGTPLSLLQLLGENPQARLHEGQIQIEGDTDTVEAFSELFYLARPDFEEELSRIVGDAVAHEAGNVVRGFASWLQLAGTSVGRSLSEYLQEERRDVPAPVEVEEFCAEVDTLVNDVARTEAKMQNLRQQHEQAVNQK